MSDTLGFRQQSHHQSTQNRTDSTPLHQPKLPKSDPSTPEQETIRWSGFFSWFPYQPKFLPWMLLLVPTVGGLVSGFLVYTLAPEAEGPGTDGAIASFHHKQGYLSPRVSLVKIVASAITIGSGGSGGREGPIAQIGAGFGSMMARWLKMPPSSCRVLLAAGVGAGVAAIFRAPLAGALFAAEVLYRSPDLESDVVIPVGMASVVSYCTFGLFFGWEALFHTPPLQFNNPFHLVVFTVLAVVMAVLAMIYTRTLQAAVSLFRKMPGKLHFKPAIGGFLTGLVGFGLYLGWELVTGKAEHQLLSVMSFGYGILQESLGFARDTQGNIIDNLATKGPYFAGILIAVAIGKLITTSLTIGSGGSGGVFGPSIVIGGCAAGALGLLAQTLFTEMPTGSLPSPTACMIVGMAGFFAAAGKVPLSTLIIVCEMTGGYFLLLPALWVCTISYMISDERSLYPSQVENRSHSPAHKGEYVKEVLAGLQVSQFLKPNSADIVVHPEDPLSAVGVKLSSSPYLVLPVVDDENALLGVVVLTEVHLATQSPYLGPLILAADLMRPVRPVLKPTDTLDYAQEVFVQNDLPALPVVDQENHVIGIVKRSDLSRIYLSHVHGVN
ncbi:MAG: chloride channel protein [Gemmataceae bacterium]